MSIIRGVDELWGRRTGTKRLGDIFGRLGACDLMRVHYFLDKFWGVLGPVLGKASAQEEPR